MGFSFGTVAYSSENYEDFWTHVMASSETISSLSATETLFMQRSQQAQQKLTIPTRIPMEGDRSRTPLPSPVIETGDSAYIVVTLLLGTANDTPLFSSIYSASVLRDVLQDITLMHSSYLLMLELFWMPQDPLEQLSASTFRQAYSDMVEILCVGDWS